MHFIHVRILLLTYTSPFSTIEHCHGKEHLETSESRFDVSLEQKV